MKHKVGALLLSAALLLSLFTMPAFASEASFSDTSGHWAADAISIAVEKGLFQGIGKNRFAPNESMSRAMFVTVLGRFAEGMGYTISGTATFSDVPKSAYYAPYVAWAADRGIVTGMKPNIFSPKTEVTREQMCTLFVRFLNVVGYPVPSGSALTFVDASSIKRYAVGPVKSAVALGLFEGAKTVRGMEFRPKAGAKRAEAATVFLRLDALDGLKRSSDETVSYREPEETSEMPEEAIEVLSAQERAEEEEIAGYLAVILNRSSSLEYLKTADPAVQSCMKVLTDCLRDALNVRSRGMILSRAYVESAYADSIARVKSGYRAMTEAQRDQFLNVAIRLESTSHLRAVLDYFHFDIGF